MLVFSNRKLTFAKNNGTDVSALPKRISTHQPRTPPGSASRLEHSMHPSGGLSLVRTLGGKRPAYLVRVRIRFRVRLRANPNPNPNLP